MIAYLYMVFAWPIIAVSIALSLVNAAINYYRARKAQEEDDDPQKFDEGSIPVVTESGQIPVVFGRVRLRAPNVVWYLVRDRIQQSGRRFIHSYLVWCNGPVDYVTGAYLDDQLLSVREDGEGVSFWDVRSGPVDLENVARWGQNLVTLEDGQGHTSPPRWSRRGDVHLEHLSLRPGLPDQGTYSRFSQLLTPNTWPDPSPAYRSVMSTAITFELRPEAGRLPPISLEVTRIQSRSFGAAQWRPTLAQVGADMNPAHIVREVYTDRQWGLGLPESLIDEVSFLAAAETLHDEGFGLSIIWTKRQTAHEFVADIMRHIDGACYTDPATGRVVLRLIRDDYDAQTIPSIGPDEIVGRPRYSRPSPSELVNEISVEYPSREYDRTRSVKVDDTALQATRNPISQRASFPAIYDPELAVKVATRELRALSQPLRSVEFFIPGELAASLRPTDVVAFSWPEWGIDQMFLRIASIIGPDPHSTSSAAQIRSVQDAFGFGDTILTPLDPEDPTGIDEEPWVPLQVGWEMPLWLAYEREREQDGWGVDITAMLDKTGGQPALAAYTAQEAAADWALISDGGRPEEGLDFAEPIYVSPFTASGLPDPLGENVEMAGYVLTRRRDAEPVPHGEHLLLYVPDVSDDFGPQPQFAIAQPNLSLPGLYQVYWGAFDSGIVAELKETDIAYAWIVGLVDWGDYPAVTRFYGSDTRIYEAPDVIDLSALPRTGAGELSVDAAAETPVSIEGRAFRPYPPGHVRVGLSRDEPQDPVGLQGALEVTWSKRYRAGEQRLQTEDVEVEPPVDVSWTVSVYATDQDLSFFSLLRTATIPSSSTSWEYTSVDEAGDRGDGQLSESLLVAMGAVRDGVESWAKTHRVYHRHPIYRFTPAGAEGFEGPTQAQVDAAYAGTNLAGDVDVNDGIQCWTVPADGDYRIHVVGAQGGTGGRTGIGGLGARMTGTFTLTVGTKLEIIVGQKGGDGNDDLNRPGPGGGGGSFVTTSGFSNWLIIAGGGGGYGVGNQDSQDQRAAHASIDLAGHDGTGLHSTGAGGTNGGGGGAVPVAGGGGGYEFDGGDAIDPGTGGRGLLSGGAIGGLGTNGGGDGGFGGGGAVAGPPPIEGAGGGGGGASGGGAGRNAHISQSGGGGGGGSINSGDDQLNWREFNEGNGFVVIEQL